MSAQDDPPHELLVLVRRDHDDGDIGMVTAQGIKHRGTWRRAAQRGHRPERSAGSGGGPSFDDLIRLQEQRRRDHQAKGLGGLEIDDELEGRGLLDGKVAGLGPFQDLVHLACGAAE
jgi:hypothetical protein